MTINNPLRIAVLCGGQSPEHEVSIISAKSVILALDPQRYRITPIFISREGQWYAFEKVSDFVAADCAKAKSCPRGAVRVCLKPGARSGWLHADSSDKLRAFSFDIVFPVLHGRLGEDGTMQGLLQLAQIPFVGASTASSVLCMDKVLTKIILQSAGLNVVPWRDYSDIEKAQADFDALVSAFQLPLFVKPVNTGSSIGVSKVTDQSSFNKALALAFRYDRRVLVEKAISGRELEIAVLGNQEPEVSCPGEICSRHAFYTYEAKYVDPKGAELVFAPELPDAVITQMQTQAKAAYKALLVKGMARVDFLMSADETLYINELNTIPGFTAISMYSKLWDQSGVAYSELLDRLIVLALEEARANHACQLHLEHAHAELSAIV